MIAAKGEDQSFEPAPDYLPARVAIGLAAKEAAESSQRSHKFPRSRPFCRENRGVVEM